MAYTATKVVFESAEGVSQSDRSKLAVQVQTIDVHCKDVGSCVPKSSSFLYYKTHTTWPLYTENATYR